MQWVTPTLVSLLTLTLGDADGFFDVGGLHQAGDPCFHLRYRQNGVCIFLNDCPTVYSDLDQKLVFPQICGFNGKNLIPNICCVRDASAIPAKQPFSSSQPSSTSSGQMTPQQPQFQSQFPPQTANPDGEALLLQPSAFPLSRPSNEPTPDAEDDKLFFNNPMEVSRPATTPIPTETTTRASQSHLFGQLPTPSPPAAPQEQGKPLIPKGQGEEDEDAAAIEFPQEPPLVFTPSLLNQDMSSTTTRRPTTTSTTPRTTTSTTTQRPTTTTTPRPTPTTTRRPTTTTPRPTTTTTRTTSRPTTTTTTTTTPKPSTTTTTTTTTPRPTTTTTTTPRPTTTTTPRQTTTTTTLRPFQPPQVPRDPSRPVNRPACFSTVPPLPGSAGDNADTNATAVLRLRSSAQGTLLEGEVEDIGDISIEPEPAISSCSADEACEDWITKGWVRERRKVSENYPLSVDEQVQVRVSTIRSGQVSIGLCSESACAVVGITEVVDGDDKAMKFYTQVTTTNDILDPNPKVIIQSPQMGGNIPSGRRYTFAVQRRSEGLLDVWLDRQPSNKASVQLEPDMSRLRAATSAGSLSIAQRQEMDGYHMDIEEQVAVQLHVTRDGLLDLGLCGDTACSVVRVTGVGDGRMGYSTRVTKSNSVAEERARVLQPATGPGSFSLNESYTFVVQRRSEWIMDVWLQGDPENRVTVPLEPDRLRLKVDSDAGITSFETERTPDGFAMPVNKQVMVRLVPDKEEGWLDLALCGPSSCSVIRVVGAEAGSGGGFSYSTRLTPTNSVSDPRGAMRQAEGPAGFAVGEPVTFVLQRNAAFMELWREGDDLNRASLAVQGDAVELKMSSTVGSASLIQVVNDGYLMEVGQMLMVRLSVTREDGWLFLGLCSSTSCSAMGIIGVSEDSRISYYTRISNTNSIVGDGSVWQSSIRGSKKFSQGMTYQFLVHRRSQSLMDVWLEVAPNRKVTVPLEDDRSKFKVASDAGDVSILYDNEVIEPGYPMAIGEEVKVKLSVSRDTGWLFIALCGRKSCSVVGIGGVADQQIDAASKITSTNNILGPGPVLTETAGPNTFSPGSSHTFVVQRRSSQLMAVWLAVEGEGASAAAEQTLTTVPLDSNKYHLLLLSSVGSISFPQGRAADGYPMRIDERVQVRFVPGTSPSPGAWLSLGLCGERACGVVTVSGVGGDPRLQFLTRTTATNSIADQFGSVIEDMSGVRGFLPRRNYTFVLHRHSDRDVDVWLKEDPGFKITVPLSPDQTILKVDSNAGSTMVDKRGAADGWLMAEGERAWLSLRVDNDNGRLQVGLCTPDECSVARITGVDEQPKMGFSTAITSTNSVSGRGDDLELQSGPIGFTAGKNHTFVIHRRTLKDLDVWLEDDPSNKATIPLGVGADRLKVTSSAGSTAFLPGQQWRSQSPTAALVSPVLRGRPGGKACVSIEFLANTKEAPLLLSVTTDRGSTIPVASLSSTQLGSWRLANVLLALPRVDFQAWKLVLSAPRGTQVRRMARCSLGSYDVVTVGEPLGIGNYPVPMVQSESFGAESDEAGVCVNGGLQNKTAGTCTCPPGFAGPTCQSGCGPNAFGVLCGSACSNVGQGSQGCQGILLCVSGLECSCAPGFKGSRCDQPCSPGEYGADCLQACPLCRGGGACDSYTGRCESC